MANKDESRLGKSTAEGAVFAQTITLSFKDRWMIYHSVTTPGLALSATSLNFTTTLDSAVTPVFEQPRFNQISVRHLDDPMLEVLEMKDADVIVGSFWTFSRDGQSLIRHGVAKAPDGRSKAFEVYFERSRAQ